MRALDHSIVIAAPPRRPEGGRQLLWNATGDSDRAKETLLNVDSLIGSTVGSGRTAG